MTKTRSNMRIGYEKDFCIIFLKSKGEAFQTLFETLMLYAYPDAFWALRPWGADGDRKNDGYLKSERTLFQVYAPNELTKAKAVPKIRDDFQGALEHWGEHFDTWVFLHNDHNEQLPPHVVDVLLELGNKHPEIDILARGYRYLCTVLDKVSDADLEGWFGPSLTAQAELNLGYEDLADVLSHIEASPSLPLADVKDVSPGKLSANGLSEAVADYLQIGMRKADLVRRFFEDWHDPLYGEEIAGTFRERYLSLKAQQPRLHPDGIYGELEAWATGHQNSSPRHKHAVHVVLAYLFDTCQIFEDAREAVSP